VCVFCVLLVLFSVQMRDALNATGRAMLFSLCGWRSWYAPQGALLGNSWRVSPDVVGYASS
jgi:hypothetical protein